MKTPKYTRAIRSSQAAFTLMEIMLVVTIIVLLVGLAITKLGGLGEVGRMAAAKAELNNFKTSLIAYRAMAGTYPSTQQGLISLAKRPESEPKPLMWRQIYEGDSIKKDPWGHDYQYAFPGTKHPTGFDLYSLGEDGQPGTQDDIWAE